MFRPNPFPSSAPARRLIAALALIVAGAVAVSFTSSPSALHAQTSTSSAILLQAGNLVYEGAFCLPLTGASGPGNPNSFHDGAEAMGFDPYTKTMVVQGNYRWGNAARVTIPTPSLTSCPRGTFSGGWLDMQWRGNASNDVRIGGFLPQANGDLVTSFYVYYDATNTQTTSHVRLSASGALTGPVRVGTAGRVGFVSGWMFPIPTEWQSLLGGPAITGNGSLSIISRTSLGPAAWVFDPANVAAVNPTPATEVLGYPITNPTLGTCETGTTFNCSASNNRAGLIWPNGTRTLLYVHHVCPQPPTYSGGWVCAVGRVTRVLAYDAMDLVAVKNGTKRPYDVVPYATWDMGPELRSKPVTSIAYDAATTRVFIAERWGDGPQPRIHVYRVNGAVTATSPAPTAPSPTPVPAPITDATNPVVTVTAPASGTTVTGLVTVAATASDNVGVAGVQFTLDGANLGPEDTTAPYQAGWDATTAGNGSHILRAIARDGAGNSSSSTVTVNVNNTSTLPDTLAPNVSLTSPADGTIISGTVTVTASATDNVGVADIQFTLNGLSLGAPVRAPYQFNWVTTGVGNRSYTLGAVARDAAGNTKAAETHTVTVSNSELVDEDYSTDGATGGTTDGEDGGWRRSRTGDTHGDAKPRRDMRPTVDGENAGGTRNARSTADSGTLRLSDTETTAAGRRAISRGSTTPSTGTTSNTDAPAAAAPTMVECEGDNPFESSAGLIGVCVDGQWTVMEGLRTWGRVRQRQLTSGASVWVIETDEAVYEVAGGLHDTYRVKDLEVLFEGRLRRDVVSTVPSAIVIELRQLSVP